MVKQQEAQLIEPLLEALTQLAIISQHINIVLNARPLGFIDKNKELMMRNMLAKIDKSFVSAVCDLSNYIVDDAADDCEQIPVRPKPKKKVKSKSRK